VKIGIISKIDSIYDSILSILIIFELKHLERQEKYNQDIFSVLTFI
jgi:hypothetical protein